MATWRRARPGGRARGFVAAQKMTSKSAVKRRPLCPKKRPNAGSAMLLWKASGLKWSVRLYALTDSRTAYLGFTLMSLEKRESTERKLGNRCALGPPT